MTGPRRELGPFTGTILWGTCGTGPPPDPERLAADVFGPLRRRRSWRWVAVVVAAAVVVVASLIALMVWLAGGFLP